MKRYAILGLAIIVVSIIMGLISMYSVYEEEPLYSKVIEGPSRLSLVFDSRYTVLRLNSDKTFSYEIRDEKVGLKGRNSTYEGVFTPGNYTIIINPEGGVVLLNVSRLRVEHPFLLLSIPSFFLLFVGIGFSMRVLGTMLKGE